MGHAHALAAAAGNWLQNDGVTYLVGSSDGFLVIVEWVAAFGHGNAGRGNGSSGNIFVSHQPDGFRHRTDPGDAGFGDLFGKICVLRKKTIARMDGIGLSFSGSS